MRVGRLGGIGIIGLLCIGCGASPDAAYAPESPAGHAMKSSSGNAVATSQDRVDGTEDYTDYGVNAFVDPAEDPLSTFSVDVDTASFTIARRKITEGRLPPFQAVRVEEFLNYFDYDYTAPAQGDFAVHTAAAPNPFASGHHVLRVGIQGRRVAPQDRKPVHLVYLVDTSGSMHSADKIGLAQKSLKMLTNSLRPGDTVALCTYAGSVREVLPPTGVEHKGRILSAIADLQAGGSTAMESGLALAYDLAARTFVAGHENRVVVLSDGDANVGAASHEEILATIEKQRAKGITLSTVGFGMGNYKDTMMEQLADRGDGNYTYIDSPEQARRVFSEQAGSMLEVIARDVKIQVAFDPEVVEKYRLVGYENRDIADEDFRDDSVDAGEIGAGHAVTAIYDVVLKDTERSPLEVRLRHEVGVGQPAQESTFAMAPSTIATSFAAAPTSLRFATAVMGFAERLRESPHAKDTPFALIQTIAREATDGRADRKELVALVGKAAAIAGESPSTAAVVAR